MRKIYLLFVLNFAFAAFCFGQTPEAIKYQAIARDELGNTLSNRNISILVNILPDSPISIPIYTETFHLSTNEFGLFNINVGQGGEVGGSFANINWSSGNYYLQISIDKDGANNYTLVGSSQLLSVPYALYSKSAAKLGMLGFKGQTLRHNGNSWQGSSLLYNDGKRIGINTIDPQSLLDIRDTVTLPWNYKLQVYDPTFTGSKKKVFLSQGWDMLFGDMVYFGSTGNRPNTKQSAMLMTQDYGFMFGRGNDNSNNLSKHLMRLDTNGNLGLGAIYPDNKLTLEIDNLSSTDGIHIKRKLATQTLGIKLEFDSDLGKYHYIFDEKNAHGLVVQSWNDLIFFSNANYEGPAHFMFFNSTGYLGLDTQYPSESLTLATGNINLLNSSKGIILDAQDKPFITRSWDKFTTGAYTGLGRWGMFMEPNNLILGIPYVGGRNIKFSAYNENSTIAANLMTITSTGDVTVQNSITAPTYKYSTPKVHYYTLGGESFFPTYNASFSNGGNYGGAYISTESAATALAATLHLPDGAVITAVKIYFYNNASAKAQYLTVNLNRESLIGDGYSGILNTTVTPVGISGYGSVNGVVNSSYATVNNQLYSYLIWAYSSNWDATGKLKIKGAVITYTTTSAE